MYRTYYKYFLREHASFYYSRQFIRGCYVRPSYMQSSFQRPGSTPATPPPGACTLSACRGGGGRQRQPPPPPDSLRVDVAYHCLEDTLCGLLSLSLSLSLSPPQRHPSRLFLPHAPKPPFGSGLLLVSMSCFGFCFLGLSLEGADTSPPLWFAEYYQQ
ncbi:unnamed protein product [Arctogadus glacialis]